VGKRRSAAAAYKVGDVARHLADIAPPQLAQDWDNVGLLAGDERAPCPAVLLSVDMTEAVVEEARGRGCGLITAYHPPVFRSISRIQPARSAGAPAIWEAVAAGIAVYSPHTALDAAAGGTNDVLAELVGVVVEGPIEYADPRPTSCKVVVFVPPAQVERVAEAMFAAGAGHIGDYTKCSFRLAGRGTFLGGQTTQPTVGRKGRLESVDEFRLETVVPSERLPAVVEAVRRFHPYEEPAFDIYPVRPEPVPGIGRVGRLRQDATLGLLALSLKRRLRLKAVEVVGSPRRPVRRVAVCAGSAGRLPLERKASAECDAVITGELRHHDALAFAAMGVAAIAVGHWASERPVLRSLAGRLRERLPGLGVRVSAADKPPSTVL